MFRVNLKWLTNPRCNPQIILRSYSSEKTTNTIKTKSGNQIKLIGRVNNEVATLRNGFNSFHIRTATDVVGNLIGVTHSIKTNVKFAETPLPELANNDLVYVKGEIVYQNVPNGEKFVSRPHIFATKVFRMINNNNTADDLEQLQKESVNEVKLMGMIGTDIHDENATIFHIVTNSNLAENLKKDFTSEWHRVIIFDEQMREFVRKNLKRTSRILVHGEIIYNKVDLENGNLAYQGHVIPNRIQKLEIFGQRDDLKLENKTEQSATFLE